MQGAAYVRQGEAGDGQSGQQKILGYYATLHEAAGAVLRETLRSIQIKFSRCQEDL